MHRYSLWSVHAARPLRTRLTYARACRLADKAEAIFRVPILVMEG